MVVQIPRVNPVGIVEHAAGWSVSPRAYAAGVRLAAAIVLGAFLVVGAATTVHSLGAYCLTSHAGTPLPFAP